MLGPRSDYLKWDDIWMVTANVISQRSKDPNTQVGACIVDTSNHIVGLGYNGFPRGCSSNAFPWERVGSPLDTKYMYVAHAESNAIDNADSDRIIGSRLYVTLFPCNNCAIRIIQNQIKEVIYLSDKYHDSDESIAARRMFTEAGVKMTKFKTSTTSLTIDLNS